MFISFKQSIIVSIAFVGVFLLSSSIAAEKDNNTIHGQWVYSDQLQPGMKILTTDNKLFIVKQSWLQRSKTSNTYNFEVSNAHTYFVTKYGFWAHNTGVCREDLSVRRYIIDNYKTNGDSHLSYGLRYAKKSKSTASLEIDIKSVNGKSQAEVIAELKALTETAKSAVTKANPSIKNYTVTIKISTYSSNSSRGFLSSGYLGKGTAMEAIEQGLKSLQGISGVKNVSIGSYYMSGDAYNKVLIGTLSF